MGARPPSWLRLVVLQPSPFCNINCDYCYLPGRTLTHRMSPDTLRLAVERIFATDLVSDEVTFVWHAGEPLAVPISWYEMAFDLIAELTPPQTKVVHSFQSNGTLINDRWCEFIKRRGVCMGLSIDGPDFIHDAHRKTRAGVGTHLSAMRGASLLQKHEISFHVIAVVTRESLSHADEIFDFFLANGMMHFGFNIEELEGAHTHSSLDGEGDDAIESFFRRIFTLQKSRKGEVRVREFDAALHRVLMGRDEAVSHFVYENEQVRPFGILSVDWEGNFSSFSPELLGLSHDLYGDFSFGNMHRDALLDMPGNPKFIRVLSDIQSGVELCRQSCEYFKVCGGGAPANKLFENQSFATTETRYCRYAVKVPTQIVLEDLEHGLHLAPELTR
jgi:uncharacterized protein